MTEETYLGSPDNPKTAAIVCYITLIGWLIAYFALYRSNRNTFSAFHIRQTLMLHIFAFLVNVLSVFALWGFIPSFVVTIIGLLLLVLWLIGLANALNNIQKPIPLIGEWAQKVFRNL
jgi:uncharacterized membrane protein